MLQLRNYLLEARSQSKILNNFSALLDIRKKSRMQASYACEIDQWVHNIDEIQKNTKAEIYVWSINCYSIQIEPRMKLYIFKMV